MSDTERNSPPVDAQAELSERDRAEVDREAERANLEAAILISILIITQLGALPREEIYQG